MKRSLVILALAALALPVVCIAERPASASRGDMDRLVSRLEIDLERVGVLEDSEVGAFGESAP